MAVSLERYLIVNFMMNATVLLIVARTLGERQVRRCLMAAGIGSAWAAALEVMGRGSPWSIAVECLFPVGMAWVAFPGHRWTETIRHAAVLWSGALFMGAVESLIRKRVGGQGIGPWSLAIFGAVASLTLALSARQRRLHTPYVTVQIITPEGTARFRALVDTGNQVHEPISGQPVLIVERRLIQDALPMEYDARKLPRGFRSVEYAVVGGMGRMTCFRPEALRIHDHDGWRSAHDLWVGVYDGQMSAHVHALAPYEALHSR